MSCSIAEVETFDQYIQGFVPALGEKIRVRFAPLVQPDDPWHPATEKLLRRPFRAQGDAIQAGAKVLDRQDSLWVIGEMGTGKTLIGSALTWVHAQGRPYRAVVMCPGHLVKKWAREVEETVPGATSTIIRRVKDLLPLLSLRERGGWRSPQHPEFTIVSRDKAKLGYFWKPAYWLRRLPGQRDRAPACPTCGAFLLDADLAPVEEPWLASARRRCQAEGCGSPLWEADGSRVRRYAPAEWVKKHLRGFFDYCIGDEVHELKGGTTAQGNSFAQLASASRKAIALTGTLLGGYADDLFYLLYRLQTRQMVDEEIAWNESMKFMERYGVIETTYRKRDGDDDDYQDNAASRGRRSTKTIRRKPGVSPLVFSKFLLGSAVFLELADIAEDLPPLDEQVVTVPLGPLAEGYRGLFNDLKTALNAELVRGSKRLLGTYLSTLLSWPDRPFGNPPIYYPGDGHLVATPPEYPEDAVYPKEEALLDFVRAERALGRRVWIFCTFTGRKDVQPRLERLLEREGIRCAILRQSVLPEEREEWVAQRLDEGVEVVISNPELVKTGLDLLAFTSLAFYETGYNCFTLRQASRRSWRIGQHEAVKVRYFAYAGTLQEQALQLMGAKLAASMALEGKFSEEGLMAMTSGDDLTTALARAIVDGLGGVESAETIWRRFSKTKARAEAREEAVVGPAPDLRRTRAVDLADLFDLAA